MIELCKKLKSENGKLQNENSHLQSLVDNNNSKTIQRPKNDRRIKSKEITTELRKTIKEQAAKIEELQVIIGDQEAQLNMNSQNSSIPPSKVPIFLRFRRYGISDYDRQLTEAETAVAMSVIPADTDEEKDLDGNPLNDQKCEGSDESEDNQDSLDHTNTGSSKDSKTEGKSKRQAGKEGKASKKAKVNNEAQTQLSLSEQTSESDTQNGSSSEWITDPTASAFMLSAVSEKPTSETLDSKCANQPCIKSSFLKRYSPLHHGEEISQQESRKRGGTGAYLRFPETPNCTKHLKPKECEGCLYWDNCKNSVSPVKKTRIKDIEFKTVTEFYYADRIRCPIKENRVLEGEFPPYMVGTTQYGVHICAMVILIFCRGITSYNRASEIMQELYHITISGSTINGIIVRFSKLLQPFIKYIEDRIPECEVNHADETGVIYVPDEKGELKGDNKSKLGWLHCLANDFFTLIIFSKSRGSEGIEASGVFVRLRTKVIHDCWSPYFKYKNVTHGLCCAHLLRELMYFAAPNSKGNPPQIYACCLGVLFYIMNDEKHAIQRFYSLPAEQRKDANGRYKCIPGTVYTLPFTPDEEAELSKLDYKERAQLVKERLLKRQKARYEDPCADGSPHASDDSIFTMSSSFDKIIRKWLDANPTINRYDTQKGKKHKGRSVSTPNKSKYMDKMSALINRLIKCKEMYLYFFVDFTVPFSNNLAEICFRFTAIREAVSKVFRTESGTINCATCNSFLDTARKHGLNEYDSIKAVLLGSTPEDLFEGPEAKDHTVIFHKEH